MLGLGVMTAISMLDAAALGFASFSYLPLIAALSLSVLLILFGTGPGSSSAKVNLGPLQPIEAIRLLLALFLAGYFGRRWELLREVRGEIDSRHAAATVAQSAARRICRCPSSSVSLRRWRSSSSRRISGPRCSCAAFFLRSMRSRVAGSAWPLTGLILLALASTWAIA